jgi:hypothetical protein
LLPEEKSLDLSLPYLELVEKFTAFSEGEKTLVISELWDHFLPLSEEVIDLLKQKKASNYKNWNIFNALYAQIAQIPWLIEKFGRHHGLWTGLRADNRNIFHLLIAYEEKMSSSLVTSLKTLHKYLLLLQHLYCIPDAQPLSPEDLRTRTKNDLWFNMYPQLVDVYIDFHIKWKKQLEDENPRYQAYIKELL